MGSYNVSKLVGTWLTFKYGGIMTTQSWNGLREKSGVFGNI